jgi:hypothetical protein
LPLLRAAAFAVAFVPWGEITPHRLHACARAWPPRRSRRSSCLHASSERRRGLEESEWIRVRPIKIQRTRKFR